MTINEIKEFVENILRERLEVPILMIGSTGIGKSYSMKELTKALSENNKMGKVGFVDLRLATQEVTDLIGIPHKVYVKKDDPETVIPDHVLRKMIESGEASFEEFEPRTYWTKPGWWPKEGTQGILALEEVNRAPEDVRQAIFQLLTEWKLHTHTLPKGWVIISLVNPDNGAYHVNKLDPAFKRRFVQVVVTPPDVMDWCIWAKKNKLDDRVIRFVSQFPKLLGKDENIDITAFPTRAGYHMLATLVSKNVIPTKCLHEVASGIVGLEAATTFVQALKGKFEKPITADQILGDYKKVKEKYQKLVKAKRNDLLYISMVDIIATCETKKLNNDEVKQLHDYLLDSMSETLTTIVLRLNDSVLAKLSKHEDLVGKILEIKKNISDV